MAKKAETPKAAAKKAAPKKAAAKKAAPKVNTSNTDVYDWTEERKQEAHAKLLAVYNRAEPERRNTLNLEYLPDGTAQTRGRMRFMHSIKL
jgi:hypothetical protein